MISAGQNELMTRIGASAPAGKLRRTIIVDPECMGRRS